LPLKEESLSIVNVLIVPEVAFNVALFNVVIVAVPIVPEVAFNVALFNVVIVAVVIVPEVAFNVALFKVVIVAVPIVPEVAFNVAFLNVVIVAVVIVPEVAFSVALFNVVIVAVGIVTVPVNVGEANRANVPVDNGKVIIGETLLFPTKLILPLVETVVKLPNVNVALSVGAVKLILLIYGLVNVPVNIGESIFAFKSSAFCVAVEIGLLVSLVLLTLARPTIDLFMPLTVPVNVGEFKRANVPDDNGKVIFVAVALLPIKLILPLVLIVVWSDIFIVEPFVGKIEIPFIVELVNVVIVPEVAFNVVIVAVGIVTVPENVGPASRANVPVVDGKVILLVVPPLVPPIKLILLLNEILPILVNVPLDTPIVNPLKLLLLLTPPIIAFDGIVLAPINNIPFNEASPNIFIETIVPEVAFKVALFKVVIVAVPIVPDVVFNVAFLNVVIVAVLIVPDVAFKVAFLNVVIVAVPIVPEVAFKVALFNVVIVAVSKVAEETFKVVIVAVLIVPDVAFKVALFKVVIVAVLIVPDVEFNVALFKVVIVAVLIVPDVAFKVAFLNVVIVAVPIVPEVAFKVALFKVVIVAVPIVPIVAFKVALFKVVIVAVEATYRLPLSEISPLTNNLPFNDKSSLTIN